MRLYFSVFLGLQHNVFPYCLLLTAYQVFLSILPNQSRRLSAEHFTNFHAQSRPVWDDNHCFTATPDLLFYVEYYSYCLMFWLYYCSIFLVIYQSPKCWSPLVSLYHTLFFVAGPTDLLATMWIVTADSVRQSDPYHHYALGSLM